MVNAEASILVQWEDGKTINVATPGLQRVVAANPRLLAHLELGQIESYGENDFDDRKDIVRWN